MRTLKLLTIMGIALAPSLFARPSIIINGDPPDPTVILNDFFSFSADALGGGDFSFVNGSNMQWTELDVFVSLPELGPITCGPGPFVTCTPTPLGLSTDKPLEYDIVFGPAPNGGLAPGEGFSIDLNDNGSANTNPAGVGSWGANTTFGIDVNSAPEPSVWALTAIGLLGASFALRRWRVKRKVS